MGRFVSPLVAANGFHRMQSGERTHERGLSLSHVHGSDRGPKGRLGAFGRLTRALHINLVRHLGCFRHHDDVIVLHFDKPTGHRKDLRLFARAHADFARLKLCD